MSTIYITGAPKGPNGEIPIRREIRDLAQATDQKSQDQFSVFILALQQMQKMKETQDTSWFQIGGIHGLPFVPWNGAMGTWEKRKTTFGGYCTHDSVLFATWHRPYLALMEQTMWAIAQEQAATYDAKIKARVAENAKTLRFPYWDWAAQVRDARDVYPSLFEQDMITILKPNGKKDEVENPLYNYKFVGESAKSLKRTVVNKFGNLEPVDWSTSRVTFRSRAIVEKLQATDESDVSNPVQVVRGIAQGAVQMAQDSLRQYVAALLQDPAFSTWDAFTDKQYRTVTDSRDPALQRNVRYYAGLEGLHDSIHGLIGGKGGHMGSIDTSAFDPVFWLHHMNVDRIWAMWQGLRSDTDKRAYVTERKTKVSNFTTDISVPHIDNDETRLSPFWKPSESPGVQPDFWNSKQVKNTTAFNYGYPETRSWTFTTTADYQKALRTAIGKLYGANPFDVFKTNVIPRMMAMDLPKVMTDIDHKAEMPAPGEVQAAVAAHLDKLADAPATTNPLVKSEHPSPTVPPEFAHIVPNNEYDEWTVAIHTSKYGLGQPYNVMVFDGPPSSDDPAGWDTDYNLVGIVGVFTTTDAVLDEEGDSKCARCNDKQDLVITGAVPLTMALLQDVVANAIDTLTPEEVVPHLKGNLNWKVKGFNGTVYSPQDVPELELAVYSVKVKIGEDGHRVYSDEHTIHDDITRGKPGGYGV